ncbi:MAG: DUF3574 domain-containing protein [Terracidiphilus sp.]|nr:DUF3574 domain-containing protein [Terracidiphilus sp.]
MRLHSFFLLFLLSVAVCCSGQQPASQTAPVAPTLAGDAAHPGQTSCWVDTKLYFGLGPAEHPDRGVSEAAWRDFLDKEVTPRFPAGLSVVDVYGQWQGKKDPAPLRLRSKLLIVDYPDTDENRAKVEAIRTAWKRQTGQLSVLRVTEPADVSF